MSTAYATPGDFVDDQPYAPSTPVVAPAAEDLIEGVSVTPLVFHPDKRGRLVELLTTSDGDIEPIVHVYQVIAAPRSVRAWVYHKRQSDRLVFTQGKFRIVLFDIRPGSPTLHRLNVFEFGEACPSRLVIPPFVAHGVQNLGQEACSFVNHPTRAFDPAWPDKSRLPKDHPGIPYRFEE